MPDPQSSGAPIIYCVRCGTANPADHSFCQVCGQRLEAPVPPPAAFEPPPADSEHFQPGPVTTPDSHVEYSNFPETTVVRQQEEHPPASTPQEAAAAQEICSVCGKPFTPGAVFCDNCGARAGGAPQVTQQSPDYTPAEVPFAEAGGSVYQPRSASKAWLPILIVVAGAGLIIGIWWTLFRSGPDVTVEVDPQTTKVPVGGTAILTASVTGSKDNQVDWSIEEGSKGGKITSQGVSVQSGQTRAVATYLAPQSPGTFHIRATSHANSRRSAQAQVVVGSSRGNASIPKSDARPSTSQIVGIWQWPSPHDDRRLAISSGGMMTITSTTDPNFVKRGAYHFTDKTHLAVDFGSGDKQTWQVLSVDDRYLHVLIQANDGATAMSLTRS